MFSFFIPEIFLTQPNLYDKLFNAFLTYSETVDSNSVLRSFGKEILQYQKDG
jgi:hypothetical protein